jgi:hypothetical protein
MPVVTKATRTEVGASAYQNISSASQFYVSSSGLKYIPLDCAEAIVCKLR